MAELSDKTVSWKGLQFSFDGVDHDLDGSVTVVGSFEDARQAAHAELKGKCYKLDAAHPGEEFFYYLDFDSSKAGIVHFEEVGSEEYTTIAIGGIGIHG